LKRTTAVLEEERRSPSHHRKSHRKSAKHPSIPELAASVKESSRGSVNGSVPGSIPGSVPEREGALSPGVSVRGSVKTREGALSPGPSVTGSARDREGALTPGPTATIASARGSILQTVSEGDRIKAGSPYSEEKIVVFDKQLPPVPSNGRRSENSNSTGRKSPAAMAPLPEERASRENRTSGPYELSAGYQPPELDGLQESPAMHKMHKNWSQGHG
jgi:hypothetical protein